MRFLDLDGKSEKEQYVEILGFVHYIMAGLGLLAMVLVVPIVLFAVTVPLLTAGNPEMGAPLGCMSGLAGIFIMMMIGIGVVSAGLSAAVGWCLQNRRAYYFVVVMACLNLLSVPLGTVLGVVALMLLFDPEIKPQFEAGAAQAQSSEPATAPASETAGEPPTPEDPQA